MTYDFRNKFKAALSLLTHATSTLTAVRRALRDQALYNLRHKAFQNDLNQFLQFPQCRQRFNDITARPFLEDKRASIPFDRHYFYHPAWACRVISEIGPPKHVDISSILRFVGDLSAFIPVDYYEFQKPALSLDGLNVNEINLLKLPWVNESIDSLSCMHVIEHIGLGRYGDKIDPDGDLKAAKELQRVVAPGGHLLVVVPVADKPRIEFNGHRVYNYNLVVKMFPEMCVEEFALIPDNKHKGGLLRRCSPDALIGEHYACGCFHFIKTSSNKKDA